MHNGCIAGCWSSRVVQAQAVFFPRRPGGHGTDGGFCARVAARASEHSGRKEKEHAIPCGQCEGSGDKCSQLTQKDAPVSPRENDGPAVRPPSFVVDLSKEIRRSVEKR